MLTTQAIKIKTYYSNINFHSALIFASLLIVQLCFCDHSLQNCAGAAGTNELLETAKSLRDAVSDREPEKAVMLLQAAGGAEKSRELARAAKSLPGTLSHASMTYSISINGNDETLTVYRWTSNLIEPVGAITQKR